MRAQCLEWERWQKRVQQLFAALCCCQHRAITRGRMYLCTTLISAQQFGPFKCTSINLAGAKSVLNPAEGVQLCSPVFWPLFTVRRFTEHERSFSTLLHTLPVIEIHTREHRNTHTTLLMDTQQLHCTRNRLKCLAKRHFDGSSGRAEHQLLQAEPLTLVWGSECLNHVKTCLKLIPLTLMPPILCSPLNSLPFFSQWMLGVGFPAAAQRNLTVLAAGTARSFLSIRSGLVQYGASVGETQNKACLSSDKKLLPQSKTYHQWELNKF